MFNSGFKPTKFDGSEKVFAAPKNMGLPKEFSYKKYLPSVLDQGQDPICVPCSLSTHINYQLNLKDGKKVDNKVDLFSIYESKSSYGEGMQFGEAFDYLQKKGVKTKQGNFKIGEPLVVRSAQTLKFALMVNGPCVGALPVYDASGRDEFWNPKNGREIIGYHAIAIVGYNEKGFIIRNSWGTSYGEDGYAFLPNEHINLFIEIWTIAK